MKYLVLLVSILSPYAYSKPTVSETTQILVQYGDRRSDFNFNGKDQILFENNDGKKSSIKISEKNRKFLAEYISKLQAESSHKLQFCPDTFIVVTKGKKSILSCLGSETKLGKDSRALVNTLSLML